MLLYTKLMEIIWGICRTLPFYSSCPTTRVISSEASPVIFESPLIQPWRPKKGLDSSKSNPFEERMCYHTHSSPNESIDCVVRCTIYRFIWRGMCVITQSFLIWYQRIDSLSFEHMWTKSIDSCGEKGNFYKFFPHTLRSTKSIDSFGGNGDFFSSCKIWIFHGYILALKLAFLQKFLNQKV